MKHRFHLYQKASLSICVLLIFTTLIAVLAGNSANAQEQISNNNLRELLESAQHRIENSDEPFYVTFKFAESLMDNDEVFWEIPYSSDEQDIDRSIGEIGDDYLCFYERAGSAYVVRCTPFSNITSVFMKLTT